MSDYRPGKEVRTVSATGGEKGQKSLRLGGADPIAMRELGLVYGMGETKYARFNYLKGYPWSLSIDALKRHLLAFEAGEEYDECHVHPGVHDEAHMDVYDPEVCDGSGLLHSAHVAWHGLTLTSFTMRRIGTDDRAPRNEQERVELLEEDGTPTKDGAGLAVGRPLRGGFCSLHCNGERHCEGCLR